MITKEFILKYNEAFSNSEHAIAVTWKLKKLGLTPQAELQEFIDTYDALNKELIDYMVSHLPKGLLGELKPHKITGAFITDISSYISVSADFTVHTNTNSINFKFDPFKLTCYCDYWVVSGEHSAILKKYHIKDGSGFDPRIKLDKK